jgi:hypothetical protein
MRHRLLLFCLVGIIVANPSVCALSQGPGSPGFEAPGKLEIAKHPLVLEGPTGPPKKAIDPVKLRAEATELADLASSVPADVDQVSQGKLPKDFADKLKRIEKLSKHLRGELNP